MTGDVPQVQACSAPVRSLIHYLTHTHTHTQTQTHTHTDTRRTHPGTMPTLSDHQDTSTLRAFLDKERKPYSKAPQPLLNYWQFGLSNSMIGGGGCPAWCRTVVPNLCGIRDWFPGRQFFRGRVAGQGAGEGWAWDGSSVLHPLRTLLLLLLHGDM